MINFMKNRRRGADDHETERPEHLPGDIVVALAGNPNVGKSTVFNALTGLERHTGNWSGKTVSIAEGICTRSERRIILADLPGTYSLGANSPEEEAARDYICFEKPDAVIAVCDASCLERNLLLVLQILEITPHVLLCLNLTDEAEGKHIYTDTAKLSELLGIPVCATSARSGRGLDEMLTRLDEAVNAERHGYPLEYPGEISSAAEKLSEEIEPLTEGVTDSFFAALRIISGDRPFTEAFFRHTGKKLPEAGSSACSGCMQDRISAAAVKKCEDIAAACVDISSADLSRDRRIDSILTHPVWGIPIMGAGLLFLFWLTAEAVNYPSQFLMKILSAPEEPLRALLTSAKLPAPAVSLICDGIWRVLSWVISVMLPPMAIFFPLFTILEDSGYLPRAAFNLDRYFRSAGGCGKQALTMAMGLGCTAVGVTGCRIIDSPRERLTAMITNSFTPCNGKLPALIAMITIFAAGGASSLASAAAMTGILIFSVILTLVSSRLLSATVLKGEASSFVLELPPYRRPQAGTVIVRSLIDRTAAVLARAAAAAAPAGIVIWLCANITIGDGTILSVCSAALDPFGRAIGLDGTVLMAFILGFPANETVLPILLMAYTSASGMTDSGSISSLAAILADNGWTSLTAVCMIIMMLCHFPCATAVLTIKKESGSLKWTMISMLLPAAAGIILCAVTANIARLFM